jgi:hypothetical protein
MCDLQDSQFRPDYPETLRISFGDFGACKRYRSADKD